MTDNKQTSNTPAVAANTSTNIVLTDSFAAYVDDVFQEGMLSRINVRAQTENTPETINELTTLNPLNTGLLEEDSAGAAADDNDDNQQPHLSQQPYSQATREALSSLEGLIGQIVDQHGTTSKTVPKQTPMKMVSTGTMTSTPIKMVSIGTMPRTPIKTASTGTLPKTPLKVSRETTTTTPTMPSSVSVAVTIQLGTSPSSTTVDYIPTSTQNRDHQQ